MENKNKTWVVAICIAVVALVFIGSTMFEHGHLKKSMYEKCMTKGYDCLDCDLDCINHELEELKYKSESQRRYFDEWERDIEARKEAEKGKKK